MNTEHLLKLKTELDEKLTRLNIDVLFAEKRMKELQLLQGNQYASYQQQHMMAKAQLEETKYLYTFLEELLKKDKIHA